MSGFAALDLDQRMVGDRRADLLGKGFTVDGKRAAGGDTVRIRCRDDQGSQDTHLGMQDADRIALGIVGAEGVGADQLRQPVGLMGLRAAVGPHLVQDDGHLGACQLPGRLTARETTTNHMHRLNICFAHGAGHSEPRGRRQLRAAEIGIS